MRQIILYNKPKNEIIIYDANINIWNKNILIKILSKIIITVDNITVLLHQTLKKQYFFIEVNNNDHLITYNSIKNILRQIYSIESKGFLNNSNLEKYPIISDFIKHLTKSPNYLRLEKSSDSYKWIFNIILLSLHELIVKTIFELEKSFSLRLNDKITDLTADLINLNKEILAKLDPSIRKKLQNRGISLIQNVYAGFDTEFKRINENKNKLLSVQLAINTKLLLRIPKNDQYKLSTIDVITGKEYKLPKNKDFNFNIIEKTINHAINNIRSLKFINDFSLAELIFELKRQKVHFIERDDDFIFSFSRSAIQPFINFFKEGDSFSMGDLVNQINLIGDPIIKKDSDKLFSFLINTYKFLNYPDLTPTPTFLYNDNDNNDNANLKDQILSPIISNDKPAKRKNSIKNLTRSSMNSFTEDKVSVTKIKNIYLIAHFSNADLSMLSDFDKFKDGLDIVQKSYITLRKPILVNGNNVFIRDTMLLSPPGKKSLEAIGKLYDGFDKIKLTLTQKENMDLLLAENKELFQDYALNDAMITLIHANYMEDFYFNLKGNAIPTTISKISAVFVLDFWRKNKYKGYQISHEFLLSNTSATITPKGLWAISSDTNVGFKINYYIANYKGGRNECFMFGVDKTKHWFDYDLASAYTTTMAFAGNPDYNNARKLTISELIKMSDEELIFSYTIIECEFAFKDNTKFPSIPCFIDKSSTAYPLKGKAILTGLEYLLAKNQGCFITVIEAYIIPFEIAKTEDKDERIFINHPFLQVIKHCQNERRKHAKNSILNEIWKLLGNGIYGLTAQGLNEKMKFNIKTNSMMRMDAGVLSNPIIASWTTAFIRCIIGESLHNIEKLNGKVVSVTTDGFITDIENLENKLLSLKKDITFFNMYRKFRNELSDNPAALELKNDGIGIISWTTRGQFSLNANIKATTGFQANNYNNNLTELNKFFTYILSTDHKRIEYIQKTLTTAKNLFLKGGHVTPVYRDQMFRLHFDNKRIIIPQLPIKGKDNNKDNFDFSNILLDSKPVKDIKNCANLRNISKILKTKTYQKHSNIQWGNTYKKFIDLAIRNFIKAILANPPLFNLTPFQNYQEIIDFIKEFDSSINLSKQKISNLRNRKLIFKTVPKVQETINFANFIKNKFPDFNDKEFFN